MGEHDPLVSHVEVPCSISGRGWGWLAWHSGVLIERADGSIWFEHDRRFDVEPRALRVPTGLAVQPYRARRFIGTMAPMPHFDVGEVTRLVIGSQDLEICLVVRADHHDGLIAMLHRAGVLTDEAQPGGGPS